MSITGAMISRYKNDSDTTAVALRNAVSTLWTNLGPAPKDCPMPYLIFKHIGTTLMGEVSGQRARIERATIQVDCFAKDNSQIETILDLVEDAYVGQTLTINPPRVQHMATYFSNRRDDLPEPANVFHGMVEFKVDVDVVRTQ